MKSFTIYAKDLSDNCLKSTENALNIVNIALGHSLKNLQSYDVYGDKQYSLFKAKKDLRFDLEIIEKALKFMSCNYDKKRNTFIIH